MWDIITQVKKKRLRCILDSLVNIINGIVSKEHKLFNTRTIAYSAVLLVLIGLESFLFISRSDVETLLLRTPGMLYQEPEEGIISNLYNYQLINKTPDEYEVRMELMNIEGTIEYIGQNPRTIKNEVSEGALFIKIPKDKLQGRKNRIKINVYNGDKLVDEVTTNFLGPIK